MATTIANTLHSLIFKDREVLDKYLTTHDTEKGPQFDFDTIIRTPSELLIDYKRWLMVSTGEWADIIANTFDEEQRAAVRFIHDILYCDFDHGSVDDIDGDRGNIIRGLDELKALADSDDMKLGIQYYHNVAMFGYEFAADWRIANWGCKWNAADTIIQGCNVVFKTPDSPPIKVIARLAKDNPEAPFYLMYSDEYLGHGGTFVFMGDKVYDFHGYAPHMTCWRLYNTNDFSTEVEEIIYDLPFSIDEEDN